MNCEITLACAKIRIIWLIDPSIFIRNASSPQPVFKANFLAVNVTIFFSAQPKRLRNRIAILTFTVRPIDVGFLEAAVGQIAVTRGEAHQSFVCERNIIVWREGDAFNRKKYTGIRDETAKIGWSSNLWWCCKGEAPFNGTSFAKWASQVKDKGSVFADPGFRDIDRRDFTLAPDSQALKIGFRPFDWRKAGRRNPH